MTPAVSQSFPFIALHLRCLDLVHIFYILIFQCQTIYTHTLFKTRTVRQILGLGTLTENKMKIERVENFNILFRLSTKLRVSEWGKILTGSDGFIGAMSSFKAHLLSDNFLFASAVL